MHTRRAEVQQLYDARSNKNKRFCGVTLETFRSVLDEHSKICYFQASNEALAHLKVVNLAGYIWLGGRPILCLHCIPSKASKTASTDNSLESRVVASLLHAGLCTKPTSKAKEIKIHRLVQRKNFMTARGIVARKFMKESLVETRC